MDDDPIEVVRAHFIGGPADEQYRIFRTPPGTVNWMTASGPFVYVLDEATSEYRPEGE